MPRTRIEPRRHADVPKSGSEDLSSREVCARHTSVEISGRDKAIREIKRSVSIRLDGGSSRGPRSSKCFGTRRIENKNRVHESRSREYRDGLENPAVVCFGEYDGAAESRRARANCFEESGHSKIPAAGQKAQKAFDTDDTDDTDDADDADDADDTDDGVGA